jgi:NAD(P)H-dependent FMN reductase
MRILAVSGSLRSGSSNSALLSAMSTLAPKDVQIVLYDGLGDLPHFNPDLDENVPPKPVADLRAQIESADAVLISSPEYAHGVPGSLKNLLDWLVSAGELVGKPVALINASPRSTFAQAQLVETLKTMSWSVVPEASMTVLQMKRDLDEAAIVADPELSMALRGAIAALVRAVKRGVS